MKITMTEEHLDKALALPWDTKTCLLAQCIADTFKEPIHTCGGTSATTESGIGVCAKTEYQSELCKRVMMFDRHHQPRTYLVEDADGIIPQLREILPFTFEAIVD